MPQPATRADSVRPKVTGVEAEHLRAVGAIPGVLVVAAGALNGPGAGLLGSFGDGTAVAWRAPGSSLFGSPVNVAAGGLFLLEDGQDTDKWVRVQVTAALLAAAPVQAAVSLGDLYNNDAGAADVTAAEAAAGDTLVYTIDLVNDSASLVTKLAAWIDPAVSGIEISDDGATWVAPTTEAAALALNDLAPAASDTLHLRRTIAPAATSDPDVLNLINLGFNAF